MIHKGTHFKYIKCQVLWFKCIRDPLKRPNEILKSFKVTHKKCRSVRNSLSAQNGREYASKLISWDIFWVIFSEKCFDGSTCVCFGLIFGYSQPQEIQKKSFFAKIQKYPPENSLILAVFWRENFLHQTII